MYVLLLLSCSNYRNENVLASYTWSDVPWNLVAFTFPDLVLYWFHVIVAWSVILSLSEPHLNALDSVVDLVTRDFFEYYSGFEQHSFVSFVQLCSGDDGVCVEVCEASKS